MAKRITIGDVAELAGVSKSTVSRCLNGRRVSADKAEKVHKAIAQTGFRSNFFAKRLKMKHAQLIGLVIPRVDSITAGKFLAGINTILEEANYQAIMLASQLDAKKEAANIENLYRQGVDGIIVYSVGTDENAFKADLPIIYIGQKRQKFPYLKFDDEAAGRTMGAYLRSMGHRRAVFAGVSETDAAVGIERKRGFVEAFSAAGDATVNFVETGFDFRRAYALAGDMYAFRPDVIVGATDNIALGVMKHLHERRLRVPDDVSVAGFGGYDVGAAVYPALTTVAFDYELLGMRAAETILSYIEKESPGKKRPLPFFLLTRDSVRAANAPR